MLVYTRSSYGGLDVSESLVGRDNPFFGVLKDGNVNEKIFIKDEGNSPFWGFYVAIADGIAGLDRINPLEITHFGRQRIENDLDLWASEKFVGKNHKTGVNNHSAYVKTTNPSGDHVFKGLVSSNITTKRVYDYELYARSHYGALNAMLTIGGAFSVSVPGTNIDISLTSLYQSLGEEYEDVTSIAAYSTNMVMIIPTNVRRVNRSGDSPFLENLIVPAKGFTNADNTPNKGSAKIHVTFLNPMRRQHKLSQGDPPPPMLCEVDDEIAFFCQTDEPTKVFVGTTSNTGCIKGSKLNFAFSILELSEVEIFTNPTQDGYHFKIWEIQE